MTTPEPLRREELIEQASLDALGLLDEFEAAHYARSFHAAPASVQEEIRAIQAAVAADPAMLSDEEPSAGLRGRVLGAVQDAMEAEAAELQPIATIGARAARRGVEAERREGAAMIDRERASARERSLQRPLMVWRAASVALAASLVTAILWVVVTAEEAVAVSRLAQGRMTEVEMKRLLGPAFPGFANGSSRALFQLVGIGKKPTMAATLAVDTQTGDVFAMAHGLESGRDYVVRLTSKDGQTIEIGRIPGTGSISGAVLNRVDPDLFNEATLEIRDLDGHLVMRGTA